MAQVSVPYLICRPGKAGGLPRYFWQPSSKLRAEGFRPQRLPLDWHSYSDAHALQAAAIAAARAMSDDVTAARAASAAGETEIPVPDNLRTLAQLIDAFTDDTNRDWLRLKPKTRQGYRQCFGYLRTWKGSTPVRAIGAAAVQTFLESLADRPSVASHVAAALRLLLEWARRKGWVQINVGVRPGLPSGQVGGVIWPAEAVAAFVETADRAGWHSVGTAVLLNEWLGQREGDVLRLARSAVRGGTLWVRQSKTNAAVALPLGAVAHLVERLQAETARQTSPAATLIVSETTGRAWSEDTFRKRFAAIRELVEAAHPEGFAVDYLLPGRDPADADAFIVHAADLTFMRLRHTAVVRLAEADCTLPQIATITGHAESTVADVIKHYMVRTAKVARLAFGKRLAAAGFEAAA